MHRDSLLRQLEAHEPFNATERGMMEQLRNFVRDHEDCFSPALSVGHITGGAWVLDFTRRHVLLTHHRKLDKWLQLGGHADGELDALAVSLREAREESGLTSVRVRSEKIFDVDVHRIPARGTQREHLHYDIRYLMEADRAEPLLVSSESKALAWVELAAMREYTSEESIMRLVARTLRSLQPVPRSR
jgi:8-oxo-dGTP pyrophosphatase MutT (NUDIX family)